MTGAFRCRRAMPLSAAIVCAICCALFGSSRPAEACPAEPLFSEYVNMADLIFVGRVVSLEEREIATPDGESYQTTIAVVRPETMLKGALDTEKTVEISNFYYAPDEGGEDALAAMSYLILASADDPVVGGYSAATARDVTDAAVADAYTSSVRDLLDILKIADGEERQSRMLEWAVRSTEQQVTRAEGIRELYALCGYEDDSEDPRPQIDSSQRERLVAALQATEKSGSGGSFELVGFLARYHDMRVIDCLVGWLEQGLDEPSDETRYVLYMIAEQLDWQTGRFLAERYPNDGELKARRAAVSRFVELMQTREELTEALEAAEPQQNEFETVEVYERETTIREAEERYEFAPEEEQPADDVVNAENPDE